MLNREYLKENKKHQISFLSFYKTKITILVVIELVPYLFFFILFIFRGEGREKESDRNINVWLPLTRPHWGPGLQPRHVP